MSKKKGFIRKMLDNRQSARDTEFEYMKTLTPEARHEYERNKRIGKAKFIIFCTILTAGAYTLGRISREGNKAIEEIGVENLDDVFEPSTASVNIAKDISDFIDANDNEAVTEVAKDIVKEVL